MNGSTETAAIPAGSRNKRKQAIADFLARRDWEGLAQWSRGDRREFGMMIRFLLDEDLQIRWRAVEGLGILAREAVEKDRIENIREAMRRLLWHMNDESGGVIYQAPEAMGEILACAPILIPEFARFLVYFMYEEPFERGIHWAMARISEVEPSCYADGKAVLQNRSLSHPDPGVRGYTKQALNTMGIQPLLAQDPKPNEEMDWYEREKGELQQGTRSQFWCYINGVQ